MQKFKAKLKNVPTNASLVCSSTNTQLNRDDSLSVVSGQEIDKLTLNNPEVNQPEETPGQELRLPVKVFVLNLRGKPLMPCSCRQAKCLLKEKKAKVVKRSPFTLQLLVATGETKQDIVLGMDSGYSNVGISCVTKKQELLRLICVLENGMSKRLEEKAMYRRGRRNKLWYRKPRFMNRVSTKKKGWLPPSTLRRFETHIRLIESIKKLLPITTVRIEVGNFDIQKINNPEISGKDYQQGSMYEYQNKRNYLMSRENGKCQFCGKDFKGQSSHIHHITPRSKGGTDKTNNLAILHKKCHEELHAKHLEKTLKKNKQFKDATFMNIIQHKFQEVLDCEITFGYETFIKRKELGILKSHSNDAFVIANDTNNKRVKEIQVIQKKKNNRCLQLNRKGFKPSIRKEKSKISPHDLFWIGKKQYTCKGMHSYGRYVLWGDIRKKEYVRFSDVTKIFRVSGLVWI